MELTISFPDNVIEKTGLVFWMERVMQGCDRTVPKISHPESAAWPPSKRRIVRHLVAILRIADALDQSHFSNVVEVKCRSGKKNLIFILVTSTDHADIDPDLYMAKRHARYFEKLFNVETSFAAARLAAKTGRIK
jgi:exopolyphosphatase / guanosine-5'-triphosphate,3'-diphosphate pyrophosphatase